MAELLTKIHAGTDALDNGDVGTAITTFEAVL
jgi:hypothetical protein